MRRAALTLLALGALACLAQTSYSPPFVIEQANPTQNEKAVVVETSTKTQFTYSPSIGKSLGDLVVVTFSRDSSPTPGGRVLGYLKYGDNVCSENVGFPTCSWTYRLMYVLLNCSTAGEGCTTRVVASDIILLKIPSSDTGGVLVTPTADSSGAWYGPERVVAGPGTQLSVDVIGDSGPNNPSVTLFLRREL